MLGPGCGEGPGSSVVWVGAYPFAVDAAGPAGGDELLVPLGGAGHAVSQRQQFQQSRQSLHSSDSGVGMPQLKQSWVGLRGSLVSSVGFGVQRRQVPSGR
jgi:hypothetical protein